MIATVTRVWPGEKRSSVFVCDEADGVEKGCYVWCDTPKGKLIAALCERVERKKDRIVLTVKPKHRYFGYEIEEADLIPEPAA